MRVFFVFPRIRFVAGRAIDPVLPVFQDRLIGHDLGFFSVRILVNKLRTAYTDWEDKLSEKFQNALAEFRPDIILILKSLPIINLTNFEFIKHELKCPVFYWSWDDPHSYRLWKHKTKCLKYIDHVFSCVGGKDQDFYYQFGAKHVHYMVHFYTPSYIYDSSLTMSDEEKAKFACDISFTGNGTYDINTAFDDVTYRRRESLKSLIMHDEFRNLKIWGRGWDDCDELVPYVKGWLDWDRVCDSYSNSRINLNFLYGHNAFQYVNQRFIQVMGCGGFHLCTYYPGLEEIFKIDGPDKEMDTFTNTDSLINKVGYYLDHESERLDIARRGMIRVQTDYSLFDYVGYMIKLMEESIGGNQ